jgi:hypothetical protein
MPLAGDRCAMRFAGAGGEELAVPECAGDGARENHCAGMTLGGAQRSRAKESATCAARSESNSMAGEVAWAFGDYLPVRGV